MPDPFEFIIRNSKELNGLIIFFNPANNKFYLALNEHSYELSPKAFQILYNKINETEERISEIVSHLALQKFFNLDKEVPDNITDEDIQETMKDIEKFFNRRNKGPRFGD